jgi:prepilin-type N-terminal cleavage/methylation domain-containing protein
MEYREIDSSGGMTGRANVSAAAGACVHQTSSTSGFTLIELLIVVGLIGTLSMIIVPRLLGYSQQNRYCRVHQ